MTSLERARDFAEHGGPLTDRDGDPREFGIIELAALLDAHAAEARERALEEACKAQCYYCAKGCALATTSAHGHELPNRGPWHVNDVDPSVRSLCEAKGIRALKKESGR